MKNISFQENNEYFPAVFLRVLYMSLLDPPLRAQKGLIYKLQFGLGKLEKKYRKKINPVFY